MAIDEDRKKLQALKRNEAIIIALNEIIDKIPNIVPFKTGLQDNLNNLRSVMLGLRPPRIMVIGRSRSGKSSLINAICGLKVAEVSDTKPETGKAEWKDYYHDGIDLLHLLDTRGLQDAQAPRQDDPATTPSDSIIQAIHQECPDVILFVCKATEVHSASQEDLNIFESIIKEIKKKYKRDLPIIGVLTKCDELAPPKVWLPTDNERKNQNIQEEVKNFYGYLKARENLRPHVKDVIPTVAYAEYEDGRNGLISPYTDERWNINQLTEKMIQYTPQETRGSLARMAHFQEFQLSIARTVVTACVALSGIVSTNPIPGSAILPVATIQTFMVMYIGWLSGREFSEQTVKDFVVTSGVGIGANAGMIAIADIGLKFVPGFGSVISAGAGAIATKGLGDTAIAYFLQDAKQGEAL